MFITTISIDSTFKDISSNLSKIGVVKGGLAFLYEGKNITPEDKASTLKLKSGTILMGVSGRGDPLKWSRFNKSDCESGQWYHGDTWDAVVYQPNKNIQWCGFGVFIPNHNEAQFDLKYKHKINDGTVSEETVLTLNCADAVDNIVDVVFEDPVAVAADEKLHIITSH